MNYKRSLWWFAPLLATQTLFVLSQVWIVKDCNSLPQEVQGECGSAWLNLAILPAELVALAISSVFAAIGIIVLVRKYRKKRRQGV